MPIELKNLPSLIAIPYSETLKKDSIQRKDFQRITLENILSLNAVISLANYYAQNRPNINESQKEKFPDLKNFDLGQISVGTWNMFSRETTRAMGAIPKALFLNNIYEMYHGNVAKEWDNLSGTLISIRNKDAHGELIPADKLGAELDKRQEILDKLVEMLDFYKEYKIISPIKTELVNGKITYNCKNFTGVNPDNISISNAKDELVLFDVYLYNSSGNVLNLSPMLINYFDNHNPNEFQLYLYSKTSNKSKGNLHYLSLSSSLDLLNEDKNQINELKSPNDICSDFAYFRIFVEDKSLHDQKKPALTLERILKNDFISKDDLIEILLKIKNDGEISADGLKVTFNFPPIFQLCNKDGELFKNQSIQQLLENDFSLDSGESFSLNLFFKSMDSGQYELPPINIEYTYEDYQGNIIKPKVEKDGTIINIETAPAIYCTIFDPADPYSLAPVLNVTINGDFGDDESGNPKKAPYIGDKIKVNIILTNMGFGIAKEIDLTVIPPKELKLITGNPRWNGNINPNQTLNRSFEFECKEPGIQSVNIREIIYSNHDGNLYKTPGGAFNLLVRNNPKIKYQWLMQEIWDDLFIDEDEMQELSVLNKKYSNFLTQEEVKQIELSTKLGIIIKAFKEMLGKKGINLIEREISNSIIALAYKTPNCIYAIIDYSNGGIKIYVKGNLKGQFELQKIDIKEKKNSSLFLNTQYFNQIGLNKSDIHKYEVFNGKIANLKGLIGRTSSWMENKEYFLHTFKETIANSLGLPIERVGNAYQKGVWVGYWILDEKGEVDKNNSINWYGIYFDEQDNLAIYGELTKNDESEFYYKELTNLGYKIHKYTGTDLPVYESIDKYSGKFSLGIEIFKSKLKSQDDAKNQVQDKIQRINLEFTKIKNANAISKIMESGLSQDIKNSISQIDSYVSEISKNLFKQGKAIGSLFKVHTNDENEVYLTFYIAKDFPLFREEQDIFSIYLKKKKFEIAFRNISDELIKKYENLLNDSLTIRKHWNKFLISDHNELEMIKEFIEYAMNNSGQYAYFPNYYLLKAFIENNWSGGLGYILEGLMLNNFNSDFNSIAEHIKKVNYDWQTVTGHEIKSLVRRFKTYRKIFGIDFIYEENLTERLIAKPEMIDIIAKVPKRKKEKEYSELELALANLKRTIDYLNGKNGNWWKKTLNYSGYHSNKYVVLWHLYPKAATRYLINNKKGIIDIRTGVSKETQPMIDKILSLKGQMETLGDMKVIFNDDLSKLGKYGRAWENPPLVTFESDNLFDTLEDYNNPEKIQKMVEEFNLIHNTFLPDEFKKEVFLENYDAEEYKAAIEEFESALATGEFIIQEDNNETN